MLTSVFKNSFKLTFDLRVEQSIPSPYLFKVDRRHKWDNAGQCLADVSTHVPSSYPPFLLATFSFSLSSVPHQLPLLPSSPLFVSSSLHFHILFLLLISLAISLFSLTSPTSTFYPPSVFLHLSNLLSPYFLLPITCSPSLPSSSTHSIHKYSILSFFLLCFLSSSFFASSFSSLLLFFLRYPLSLLSIPSSSLVGR